ncbi:hypothetical protein D3C78_401760 [compost metagenome]
MLEKSAVQRGIEALVANPHVHYEAQLEAALFHQQAIDLIRRLKVYADRSASPIAHELCVEATEFVARHQQKKEQAA